MRVSGCGLRNMKSEPLLFTSHGSHSKRYRLYYENNPTRLSACPLTIHGLLHIAWGIRVAGPVWTYWAYAMERHCNTLLQSIKSRRHPYASINSFVTATAQLNQIRLSYDLHEALSLDPDKEQYKGFVHDSCMFNLRQIRLLLID